MVVEHGANEGGLRAILGAADQEPHAALAKLPVHVVQLHLPTVEGQSPLQQGVGNRQPEADRVGGYVVNFHGKPSSNASFLQAPPVYR